LNVSETWPTRCGTARGGRGIYASMARAYKCTQCDAFTLIEGFRNRVFQILSPLLQLQARMEDPMKDRCGVI
jgi:hypothetical protein